MTTVWVGDVDHLRQGCFYFCFQNVSTFASLHVDGRVARAPGFCGDGPERLARPASGQVQEKMYPLLHKK